MSDQPDHRQHQSAYDDDDNDNDDNDDASIRSNEPDHRIDAADGAAGAYFQHVVVNDSVTEDEEIDEERLLEYTELCNTTITSTEIELRKARFKVAQLKAECKYWAKIQSVRKSECQKSLRQLREAETELESKCSEVETLSKDLYRLQVEKAEIRAVSVLRRRERTLIWYGS